MMWLDFELQCFDKSKQAKQRPGLGKSDRWPVIGVSLDIGHHHNQWPQTRDWSHTGVSSYLPDCPAELQSAVFTLISCSFQGHQQQACQCGEGGGFKKWCVKRNCSAEKQGLFFSRYHHYALFILIGTKASQFQAWQFWLWWNISWKWRELSSSRNGLAFPHFTIPYW